MKRMLIAAHARFADGLESALSLICLLYTSDAADD